METNEMKSRENPGLVEVAQNLARVQAFAEFAPKAALFGALFAACIYMNNAGILYPVFVAGALYLLHRQTGTVSIGKRQRLFYVVSLLLLSVQICTTASWVLRDLDYLAILLLAAGYISELYIAHAASQNQVKLRESASQAGHGILTNLQHICKVLLMPLLHLPEPFTEGALFFHERRMGKKKDSKVRAVILGIVIAIPILAVILSILMSADLVFDHMLRSALEPISLHLFMGDFLGVCCYSAFGFVCFYTVCRNTFGKEDDPSLAEEAPDAAEERTGRRITWNPVTGITLTGLIAAVYILFCAIQLVYLVGHHQLPAGYTYAEYAHEGFYQLVFVSILNLLLVPACRRLFGKSRVLTGILLLISMCTYVMIASSGLRMILYIGVYHLTFLRVFVLWFLTLLALWLTYMIIGLRQEQFPVYQAALVTVTVMYLIFAFAHPDYWIARFNMQFRTPKTEYVTQELSGETSKEITWYYMDESYLIYNLSGDAVPALSRDARMLEEYRGSWNGVRLLDDWNEKSLLQKCRTWNLSEAAARRYLEK